MKEQASTYPMDLIYPYSSSTNDFQDHQATRKTLDLLHRLLHTPLSKLEDFQAYHYHSRLLLKVLKTLKTSVYSFAVIENMINLLCFKAQLACYWGRHFHYFYSSLETLVAQSSL